MAGLPPDSPAARIDPVTPTSPWTGVGAVLIDEAPFSGVAIGRRHVLTAAHVVGTVDPQRIRFRVNAGGAPIIIQASQTVRHPGFVGFGTPNVNDDIAVIVLESDLPASIATYALYRSAPTRGMQFIAVGYGASGQGDGTGRVGADPAVRRVGRNAADQFLADDEGSGVPEVYVFDFDGGSAPNFLGGASLGNAIETSFGSGDSGSPSFVAGTQPPALFGINTFLSGFSGGPTDPGTFGTGGGGMLASGYATWIDGVIAATTADAGSSDVPLPAWLAWALGAVFFRWLGGPDRSAVADRSAARRHRRALLHIQGSAWLRARVLACRGACLSALHRPSRTD
jgi:hypothetical protein